MGHLTVTFQGSCAHFVDSIPHIPHRVVLPDAVRFHHGFVTVDRPEGPKESEYFLAPHYARLLCDDVQASLTVDDAMYHGWIYESVRLRVENACEPAFKYENWDALPRLVRYDRNYRIARGVVDGPGARCQFDFDGGTFTVFIAPETRAFYVTARIATDGAPQLRVLRPGWPTERIITLPEGANLVVENSGPMCREETARFDFLVNYLTAEGGIPRHLAEPPPGMFPDLEQGSGGGAGTDTSAACSNTGYP
ncbi:MAG TPA: hypothetical protein VGF48_14670 [Thermoanaerobaculia bacterium]|jgi:hypothetical protein